MKKTMVRIFSSDVEMSLNEGIAAFITDNNLEVINVSHSVCFDHKRNEVLYSVAIVYYQS